MGFSPGPFPDLDPAELASDGGSPVRGIVIASVISAAFWLLATLLVWEALR